MGSHLFLLGFIFGLFHVLVAGPDSTKYAARYRSTLNCIFKNNLGGKSWLEESDIRVLKKCLKDSERTPPLKFTDLFSNKYNDRNSRKNVDEISLPMFTTVINANPPEIKYIWVPDDLDTIKDTMKDLRKPLLSMLLAKRNQIKSNRDQYMSKCFSEYTNFEDMDESELRKCFQQITGFSAIKSKPKAVQQTRLRSIFENVGSLVGDKLGFMKDFSQLMNGAAYISNVKEFFQQNKQQLREIAFSIIEEILTFTEKFKKGLEDNNLAEVIIEGLDRGGDILVLIDKKVEQYQLAEKTRTFMQSDFVKMGVRRMVGWLFG